MITAITRETVGSIAPFMHFENNAPEKAPTHINPACPRLNSPRIPTVRFRERARIIYTQRGTRSPCIRLESRFPAIIPCTIRYAARTIPYVMRLLFVVLFNFFFSMSATSYFLLNVLTKNTGRFHNQNYDQNTEYNGISHL